MFAMPDAAQLVELAASLNLRLSPKEAELYLPFILDAMRELDAFVQSRAEEAAPPLLFPERGPGYRPSLAEDRYQAWLWKCAIGGGDSGLLAGKTVSFKDHISVAGIPQVFTSQALEGFIPDVDATVVTRVLAAGGKVTGKHMMNGFMGDYGKPLNPHNPERITGGSSSGSGAALAAGEVDISFGGDQGGSIRLPAAYCGVVGLKPTFGLVSHFAVGFAAEPSVDHVGPMARTVPDVAAALQAVAGYDDNDPRQRRGIPESIDALSDLDGGVRGLRIGILEEGFAEPIEPEVAEGVLAAVSTLEKLGAEVSRISVPQHAQIDSAYAALVLEGARAIHDVGLLRHRREDLLSRLDHHRDRPDVARARRHAAAAHQAQPPGRGIVAAQLPRRRVCQGAQRAAGLCRGVRPRAGEGRRAGAADGAQHRAAGGGGAGRPDGGDRWRICAATGC